MFSRIWKEDLRFINTLTGYLSLADSLPFRQNDSTNNILQRNFSNFGLKI
jgi:hypothetical protein